jgi:hypothetical protein
MLVQAVEKLSRHIPEDRLTRAWHLFEEMITGSDFPDFLTLRAYDYLD